jgi:xanthine/uracil permease
LGSIFSLIFQSYLGAYSILFGINGGMILGAILGATRDSEAKKQGRFFKI